MKSVATKSSPVIEGNPESGFRVALFLSDEVFDYDIPFRKVLMQLVDALRRAGDDATIDLPPQTEREDFVTGKLVWKNLELPIYFEHSLGYMELSAPSREQLEYLVTITMGLGTHDV